MVCVCWVVAGGDGEHGVGGGGGDGDDMGGECGTGGAYCWPIGRTARAMSVLAWCARRVAWSVSCLVVVGGDVAEAGGDGGDGGDIGGGCAGGWVCGWIASRTAYAMSMETWYGRRRVLGLVCLVAAGGDGTQLGGGDGGEGGDSGGGCAASVGASHVRRAVTIGSCSVVTGGDGAGGGGGEMEAAVV